VRVEAVKGVSMEVVARKTITSVGSNIVGKTVPNAN
jgi:ABC-type branched-subunit amino acid transport system ATPase component